MTTDSDETYLVADGFNEAIIGIAHPWQAGQQAVVVYDAEKCIEILMARDDCTYEEAVEYFEFNVSGGYVGEQTPIFVYRKTEE